MQRRPRRKDQKSSSVRHSSDRKSREYFQQSYFRLRAEHKTHETEKSFLNEIRSVKNALKSLENTSVSDLERRIRQSRRKRVGPLLEVARIINLPKIADSLTELESQFHKQSVLLNHSLLTLKAVRRWMIIQSDITEAFRELIGRA